MSVYDLCPHQNKAAAVHSEAVTLHVIDDFAANKIALPVAQESFTALAIQLSCLGLG